MKLIIKNKRGDVFTALYDECDHDLISKHRWHIQSMGYVMSSRDKRITGKGIYFHRLILGVVDRGLKVDHINHNPMDNRRANLRICTHAENMRNRKPHGSSPYLGVRVQTKNRKDGSFSCKIISARIKVASIPIHLGSFKTEEDAARAYDAAAREYFGEFANLNFPDE